MEYIKQWAINDKEKKEYVRGKFNIKRLPQEGREIIISRQVGLNSFSVRNDNGNIILATVTA